MVQPIFITGIGTDVGKTIASVIVTNALAGDYWKPVQAGYENGTDSEWVKSMLFNADSKVHPETYKLKLAASPHVAAREEGVKIETASIVEQFKKFNNLQSTDSRLVIEGAGGLLVPLNENEFVIDLIKALKAKVILVSRNYLGSINHSLMTAKICKAENIDVIGWLFNDDYLNYEKEISNWTGWPVIGKIPHLKKIDQQSLYQQSLLIKNNLLQILS